MKRFLVLCSLFLFLPAASRAAPALAEASAGGPSVFIGEIAWAGSMASTADEWLELCGPPGADVSGWTIEGAAAGGSTLMLPSRIFMPERGAFLISNYAGDDPKSTLAVAPDWVTTTAALSNSALFLTLRDAAGAIIDAAGQSGAAPLAGNSGAIKASMERLFPLADGALSEAWASASTSVGFDAGATEFGTPGVCPSMDGTGANVEDVRPLAEAAPIARPAPEPPVASATRTPAGASTASVPAKTSAVSQPTSAVRISEAYPSPSTGEHEWIELTNPSSIGELLDGWTIEDGKGTATTLSGILLPWNRMVIISPKGQLNSDGDLIALKDPSGRLIDRVAYGAWDSTAPNVGDVRRGESLIRLELQGIFTVTTTPTPGSANLLTGRAEAPKAPATEERGPVPVTKPVTVVSAPVDPVSSGPSPTISVAPPARAIAPVAQKTAAPASTAASKTKKPAASRYKGLGYVGIVASPPGVYSKTRMFALIDGDVSEVRLSSSSSAKYEAGARIAFVAQEKTDGSDPYLLANPNSIRMLDASASATFATIEAWPDSAGAYRLNAEVVSIQAGVLEAKIGGVEGGILAPAALTSSLKPGDIVRVDGYVSPGPRPLVVLARPSALTLFKAYQAEALVNAPSAKLPWPATVGLTLLTALIGTYAYLRHQRLQRLALVLSPVDAEEGA